MSTRVSRQSVLQECPKRVSRKSVPQECPTRVSYKSVPQECPTRVTHKSVLQECPTRVSRKSVPQGFPTRVSHKSVHKSVPQECPMRVSYKSVPQECPTRVSYKSVPQECPARVSQKSVPQECPVRVSYKSYPQECPTRVSYKSVIWTHVGLHSGSWVPPCFLLRRVFLRSTYKSAHQPTLPMGIDELGCVQHVPLRFEVCSCREKVSLRVCKDTLDVLPQPGLLGCVAPHWLDARQGKGRPSNAGGLRSCWQRRVWFRTRAPSVSNCSTPDM